VDHRPNPSLPAATDIITISGDLGSGKSTVSHLLADRLGFKRYSTGDIQRDLAKARGMSSLEFNRLAEGDPSIDRLIDKGTADLAAGNCKLIFDSRLAWHFVPVSFKVYLSVDPVVAANRIFSADRGAVERYGTVQEAITKLRERRRSEAERFAVYYGIKVESLRNFDLVIDSSFHEPEQIADLIGSCFNAQEVDKLPTIHLSPKVLYPLAGEERPLQPLALVRVAGFYYSWPEEEHQGGRTAPLPPLTEPLLSGYLAYEEGELTPSGKPIERYVAEQCTPELIARQEQLGGFRYPSYPPHPQRGST